MDIVRLGANEERPEFSCEDEDLNEFFHKDSQDGSRQLFSVTYTVQQNGKTVAFFSLSNDAIRRDGIPEDKRKKFLKPIPRRKRYPTLPAVKIGRLAVAEGLTGSGLGSDILSYLKAWFTKGNKTGCRFIIVDAYTNPKTLRFYTKNGFETFGPAKPSDSTQLMYFDLLPVSLALNES